MKKMLFSSRNNIFACLSFFMPIFIFVFVKFYFFILIRLMNIQLIVYILGCVGIVLGALGYRNNRETKPALVTKVFSVVGILLGVGIFYFGWTLRMMTMTGIIFSTQSNEASESHFGYEGSLQIHVDPPADESFERIDNSFAPVFIVNILPDTKIYEQVGKQYWQKRLMNKDHLQINQHIRVDWDGAIWITDPPQADAIMITILDK